MEYRFDDLVADAVLVNTKTNKEYLVVERDFMTSFLRLKSKFPPIVSLTIDEDEFDSHFTVVSCPVPPKPPKPKATKRGGIVVEVIPKSTKKETYQLDKRKGTDMAVHSIALAKELEKLIGQEYPSAWRTTMAQYVKYRNKFTFVRVYHAKKFVRIAVRAKDLPPSLHSRLTKVVPERFKWGVDGIFNLYSKDDLEVAMEMIAYSYDGALKND